MRRLDFVVLLSVLFGSFLVDLTKSISELEYEFKSENTGSFRYDRMDEVKRHCRSVISAASELNSDITDAIEGELEFRSGDWKQVIGNASILPFDDGDSGRYSLTAPFNLVSFWVTNVDREHRTKRYVRISGILMMAITLDGLSSVSTREKNLEFEIWPGHTQLLISLQGIYTESKPSGGERLLCLLGETMLPSRESDSGDQAWKWVKESHSQPPLLQDDQILLFLRYPKKFTLTSRVIQGEMKSLNPKDSLKYFDEVRILSQLGQLAHYEFSSENIVYKACHPYPYRDNFTNIGVDIYKGHDFCEIFKQATQGDEFGFVPNWRCDGTSEFCSRLGPFESDSEIRATNGSFKAVKLYMQNIRCVHKPSARGSNVAKVAAVFRASPPSENCYIAAWRSAPSNMTLSVEGVWQPSSGQICMVGCPGLVDSDGSGCNTRVCLYIPVSFSIKQRSIITGSFFSANGQKNASYFPLAFEKIVQPSEVWNVFHNPPRYTYSKIEAAGAVLERNEPFSFGTVVKKSLLRFPKLEDSVDYLSSLSVLSEDLTIHVSALPDSLPDPVLHVVDVGLDIISLGPLFGRYWSARNNSQVVNVTPYHTKVQYTEKQLLLNVSAQLSITGMTGSNISMLFLEGLYDEHVGKMYLVGCRDVRASWKVLLDSDDLEAGLDCLIEAVISYPPRTSRWLVNPSASVSVTSHRSKDDPLYFNAVHLRTAPIFYRSQREDMLSQTAIEGILRILTVSFAIACVLSQVFYIRHETSSVAFMSLVMLGAQAFGYGLPLITGAEALLKRRGSKSYESRPYNLESHQWFGIVDNTVKALVMVLFLMTLRLCQKVWKARRKLSTQTTLDRVPTDKRIVIITLTIHTVGYILTLILQSTGKRQRVIEMEDFADPSDNSQRWISELEEYIGLVLDFFLLPQVVANCIWQIECQPLRKLYFLGITVVRILPHLYDYIRAPDMSHYFDYELEFANPSYDFFSKSGDIAIPVAALILAATVYLQQRLGYDKLSQFLAVGRFRLLPERCVSYERLSTKAPEAELASSCTTYGNDTLKRGEDDEE